MPTENIQKIEEYDLSEFRRERRFHEHLDVTYPFDEEVFHRELCQTDSDSEIYDENNNLLVIATSKWTLVDINKGKMAELTPEIINLYKREDKSVFEERNMPKLKEPASAISKISYPILRSDIDINNHVHNLYYLDFAYEALPEDVYRAEECDNIEIMYKKQIKLGDKIVCKYSKENNEHIIIIKSEDESVLHAIVKLY